MLRQLRTEEQTPELCLEAIQKDAFYLEYIHNKTHELCLEAVKRNGLVLGIIEDQTPELCEEAVKENVRAFQFVKKELQTPEMCIKVMREDRYLIKYIKTFENCLAVFIQFRIKEDRFSDFFFRYELGAEMFNKIKLYISDNRPDIKYSTLPEDIKIEELEDPITLEPLETGKTYGFFVEKEKWYLGISLELADKFIKEKFRGSNSYNVFIPTLNKLHNFEALKWVKL